MEIKKIIAGLMAFTMCVGFIENPVFSGNFDIISVSAEEEKVLENGLTYEIEDDHVVITGCSDKEIEKVEIPAEIDGLPVTRIGEYAFSFCTSLTEITIPDSVTIIENHAFSNCRNLTEITIPDGVTTIDVAAFVDCEGLTKITIPNSVTTIGIEAFENCTGLTEITIPEGVSSIGDVAFMACTNLKEATIAASVTDIGTYAFGYYYESDFEKIDGFKIKGYTGTVAEEYAKENEFEFIALENEEKPPVSSETGDVDGDGEITSEDALKILQMIVGLA